MRGWRLAAATMLAIAPIPASAAELVVPAAIIAGDPSGIVIRGVAPGERVRLHALRRVVVAGFQDGRRTERPVVVHAWAEFAAGADGSVAIDGSVPLAGTYAAADINGLLWSGWPVGDARLAAGRRDDLGAEAVTDAGVVVFRLERASALGPATPVPIRSFSSNVVFAELEVARDGVSGVFAAPPGAARGPAIILLHGSEGGAQASARAWAGRMAERGFAALAINYVAYSWSGGIAGVPETFTNLPVEVLDRARTWLAQRPEVDAQRIGLLGASKGAELALVGASTYPWVRAVVGCVPSDIVWAGYGREPLPGERLSSWSRAGQPLPFVAYDRYEDVFSGRATAAEVHVRSRAAADPATVAASRIPVERIGAPVLLLGAGADQVWPSLEMSRTIAARYRSDGRADRLRVREFPAAGHNICGTGATPEREDGNDGAATAIAAGEAFRATIAFLRETL